MSERVSAAAKVCWPGCLSTLKPWLHTGTGGPSLMRMREQVPIRPQYFTVSGAISYRWKRLSISCGTGGVELPLRSVTCGDINRVVILHRAYPRSVRVFNGIRRSGFLDAIVVP